MITTKCARPALSLAALAASLALSAGAAAQERPIAFTGATILPISGPAIENGTLVIAKGEIVAVGAGVAIPQDAERRDVSGRVIMPGIVDPHSHIGEVSGADRSGAIQPDVRALDSINVRDSSIRKARAGGVTTSNIMPGSGFLMSGQTFYMKLRDGQTIEDYAFLRDDGRIMGGMKMANGTNPLSDSPNFPGTRARSAAMVRAHFLRAQEYCGTDRDERETTDLGLEAMCEVLSGERLVHFHTHRADDIMTAVRLRDEFGFEMLVQHGMEAYKVADRLAAAGVPVSTILVDSPGGKLEAMDASLETASVLERAGVLTSLHSDDPIVDSRFLFRQAGIAVRAGMSREGALAALTLNGAKQMGLDQRIGSLEPGKDADFLILDGDPLSVYTDVLETWVEGERLFDRANPEDALFATGGYGAGDGQKSSHTLEHEAAMMEGTR